MTTATSTHDIRYRGATRADLEAIERLLLDSSLPTIGVAEALDDFVVAEHSGAIVGVAGLERHGDRFGLLRSAAVHPTLRGLGVGRALVEQVIAGARARGLESLYLLTTTAETYFPSFGFERTTRDAVPEEVRRSDEFTTACPASAVVMRLGLGDESSAQ